MHSAIPVTLLVPFLILGARASREAQRPAFLGHSSCGEQVARPAPCDEVRAEKRGLQERLADLDRLVVELASHEPARQRATTRLVIRSLREVEFVLDRSGRETEGHFPAENCRTALLGRWIDELATIAGAPTLDTAAFARRAQRLLGVLEASLDAEADAQPAATAALDEPPGE